MVVLRYISLLQFVLIWMYILLPLLELWHLEEGAEKPFPYRMLFPYDTNQTFAYTMTYFLTSLAGFGVVTNLFSEDSLFGFFTTHTCGRFRLLHERISNLMRDSQKEALKKQPNLMKPKWSAVRDVAIQNEYRDHLIRIVQDHNILIRYVQFLDTIQIIGMNKFDRFDFAFVRIYFFALVVEHTNSISGKDRPIMRKISNVKSGLYWILFHRMSQHF